MLEIIHQEESFVAINKPHGLLVHRTSIATEDSEFALQMLRDQLNQHVYPIHRLDRKTSGVLLFALDSETTAELQACLQDKKSQKRYIAIVRGYFPDEIEVDYPLTNDSGKTQDAITHFKCIERVELPIPFGKFETSRYSLVEAKPKTGRMHQIRKHLDHLRYPIIGDRPHGCNKQNKLYLEKWNMKTMMLHAVSINIKHPKKEEQLLIEAKFHGEFIRMMEVLGFDSGKI